MSNLFNYINKSLIGAVIEGYEYSIATGHVASTTSICYVVDRVEMLMNEYDHPVQVYITIKIDPAYTTYTSIDASNLKLAEIVYIPANLISRITEFPETPPLISQEEGLLGANIIGHQYNIGTGITDSALTTCRVIDKVKISVNNVLTDVYVCVLYSGTTGLAKIYIPIHLLSEVVSFAIVDPGLPSVLRYTAMNFVQDATVTTILFKDSATGNILRTEPINSIQAVANGTDIRIQKTGGSVILIDALDITTTYIDGVVVTAVLATALTELNALFAHAGSVGNAPTITSTNTINLTFGGTINYVLTGTDIVAVTWDISTTGTVPLGHLSNPVGNPMILIGGSTLPVNTYTIYVTAINYYGSITQTITINVALAFVNTLSLDGGSSCYATNNGTRGNTPFERPANGPGQPNWTMSMWFRLTSGMTWADPVLFTLGYFSSSWAGKVQLRLNAFAGIIQPIFHYGANVNHILGKYNSSVAYNNLDWHHLAWSYNGGDTTATGCFKYYFDGVNVTSSAVETVGGVGYNAIIAEVSPAGPLELFKNSIYQVNSRQDEFASWPTQLSDANITSIYNSGTPIDLDLAAHGAAINGYKNWYRCGDNGGVAGFPTMADMNTATGSDLTITNGTVANYVSDVP